MLLNASKYTNDLAAATATAGPSQGSPLRVTVVRELDNNDHSLLCRVPKTGQQLRNKYTTLAINPDDLEAIGEPENLLDGSLFPTSDRPTELKVTADFVTCTQ